jgi:hypothetical protein
MRQQPTSKEDSSVAMTSGSKPRMPWRLVEAAPLENYRLAVRFVDGTTGTVSLARLIRSPRAGVFARLADQALFNQVFVEEGAVTWPGELDLAPDAMYAEIRKTGEWTLT